MLKDVAEITVQQVSG